jgi:hypothetical protein
VLVYEDRIAIGVVEHEAARPFTRLVGLTIELQSRGLESAL